MHTIAASPDETNRVCSRIIPRPSARRRPARPRSPSSTAATIVGSAAACSAPSTRSGWCGSTSMPCSTPTERSIGLAIGARASIASGSRCALAATIARARQALHAQPSTRPSHQSGQRRSVTAAWPPASRTRGTGALSRPEIFGAALSRSASRTAV